MKKKPRKRSGRARRRGGIPRGRLHDFYYYMALTRALEDRIDLLYRQGRVVGSVFSSRGQEAISVGAALALKPGDYCCGMIRNLGVYLIRGYTPRDAMLNWLGRADGPTGGKDTSQHFGRPMENGLVSCTSMLGTTVPVMVGMALASKLKKQGRVALAFIGDGATSVGDFHEGMNFAAVMRVPFVLIIENNQYAYSTSVDKQSPLENIADRALAYGIPGRVGDGNDVLEVHRLTTQTVEDARAGRGPAVLEFKTMRMRGHAAHDDASYVPPETREKWERKDPIRRCLEGLLGEGLMTEKERDRIDRRVESEVNDATEHALSSPLPDPEDVTKGVFADDEIVRPRPWMSDHE